MVALSKVALVSILEILCRFAKREFKSKSIDPL